MWPEWGRQDTLINTAYRKDCLKNAICVLQRCCAPTPGAESDLNNDTIGASSLAAWRRWINPRLIR